MTITICGSMQFHEEMLKTKTELEALWHTVFIPSGVYDKNGIRHYIGGNTFLEMGHAFGLGKKIYLLYPIPQMDYKTEMHAMQPVVLHGDLNRIQRGS